MSDVKRYSLTATHDADENGVEMGEFPDGEWVKFEDYQRVAQERDVYAKIANAAKDQRDDAVRALKAAEEAAIARRS